MHDFLIHNPSRLILSLEFYDNTPFLMGALDGKPVRFLLDSGAQDITLNSKYFEAVSEKDAPKVQGFTGEVRSSFAKLGTLNFGEWKFEGPEAMLLDLAHLENAESFGVSVHGMIGFRQLIHFDWMIDYKRAELHLWHRFLASEYAVVQKLRVRYRHHVPMLEVEIAEKKYNLLVDTGASELIFDPKKREEVIGEVEVHGFKMMASGSPVEVRVEVGTLSGFKVGDLEFGPIEIRFSDMAGLQNAFGEVDGIFGYGLLSQCNIVVCWNSHRMYFLGDQSCAETPQ